MKFAFRCAMVLLGLALAPICLQARPAIPPPFIQDRSIGVSLADELKSIASSGATSKEINREGRRILSNAYSARGGYFAKSFPRGFHLDLSKDDVRRVATNLLQGNRNNWHGYERELKFLNVVANKKSPFELLSVNDRAKIASGKLVEFDAVIKDKRITSMAQLEDAKKQIDKIASRARSQGVSRSIWVNRARLSANLRQDLQSYAARRNVTVYAGVSTSDKLAHNLKNPQRFDDVLEREAGMLQKTRWVRVAGRVVGVAATAYGAGKAAYAAYRWQQGGMTTRTATVTASEGVGAAAGGASGAYLGAQLGAFGGPVAWVTVPAGGVLGGVVGAFAGGLGGKAVGETFVDEVIFKDLEHNETTAVIAYLQQQY